MIAEPAGRADVEPVAVHGLRRWQIDPSAWLITGLERLGLVWNVVRISPERLRSESAIP